MRLTRQPTGTDIAQQEYTAARVAHWDHVAAGLDANYNWSGAYHARLTKVFRSLVAPNQRVLEIGCGQGDLLAALQPSFGAGGGFFRRHAAPRRAAASAAVLCPG